MPSTDAGSPSRDVAAAALHPICKRRLQGRAPMTTPCLRRSPMCSKAASASKSRGRAEAVATLSCDEADTSVSSSSASSSSASGSSSPSPSSPSPYASPSGKRTSTPSGRAVRTDSTEDPASEAGSPDSLVSDDPGCQLGEQRRQGHYWRHHIYRRLYPALVHPEPDDYFSREDCEALAAVHSRHRQLKWLEMKASLFNLTGRMVPLAIIRDRCERAEADETQGPSEYEQSGQLAGTKKQ